MASPNGLVLKLRQENADLVRKVEIQDENLALAKRDLDNALEVKGMLKSKLKDCKYRLEQAVQKYEELANSVPSASEENVSKLVEEKKILQEAIVKLERENKSNKENVCLDEHNEDLRKEMQLQKVEIRLGEKKLKEAESRIKFLREVMIKKEKDEKELAEKALEKAKEEIESLKTELENRIKVESKTEELEQAEKQVENLREENGSLLKELDKAKNQLQSAKTDLEEKDGLKKRMDTLKVTCLEQQDQIRDYEKLLGKLEVSIEAHEKEKSQWKTNNESLKTDLNATKADLLKTRVKLTEAEMQCQHLEESSKHAKIASNETQGRVAQLQAMCDAKTKAFEKLKTDYENLVDEVNKEKAENMQLTNELKKVEEAKISLEDKVDFLSEAQETSNIRSAELKQKVASKKLEIKRLSEEVESLKDELDKREVESNTQIAQLKKLIDHLQVKAGTDDKRSKSLKDKRVDWAMSYEQIQEELANERKKNEKLQQEVTKAKQTQVSMNFTPLKTAAACSPVREFKSKEKLAETGHSIPHRFHRQTNIRAIKCHVCLSHISFCKTVSVCKFCHISVHTGCETKTANDCGLSGDMAKIIQSNAQRSKDVSHQGYLRVPEPGNENWKEVAVQIVKNRLVINGGESSINLVPEKGFVFIQSTVAYNELLHTSAYEKPHVFKIGYSYGSKLRNTHFFMAKSFQEKAAWIEAIEKITLESPEEPEPRKLSPSKNIARSQVLGTFPFDINIYCALQMRGKLVFGTSNGIYIPEKDGTNSHLIHGPSRVFQMCKIQNCDDVVMIAGSERRLLIVREAAIFESLLEETKMRYRNVEALSSCHLFEVGYVGDEVFICAVDDCRVSILGRDNATGEIRLLYGFSTDQPTSCITFNQKSVLVMTDKIYEIQLDTFAVREFLSESLYPTLLDNQLVAMYKLKTEFLICFQTFGLFVDMNGERAREDVHWNCHSGQFFYGQESNRLWMTHYNALEAIDLDSNSRYTMIQCKNPQIVHVQNSSDVVFVNKKTEMTVIMRFDDSI